MTIINIGDYKFKNYTILNENELKLTLKFRNENRQWMINDDIITLEEHIKWINTLQTNNKIIYYLVYKNNIPFISISYHDINWDKKEAYWGYFLGDKNFKSEVLKIEKIIIDIAFNQLKLNKLYALCDINNHVIYIHKFFGFKEDKIVKIKHRNFLKMYLEKRN